jgi:hypothetical protein
MQTVSNDKFKQPERNVFKFTLPGDFIKGVVEEVSDFEGDYGKTKKFTIKAMEGKYHPFNKETNETGDEIKITEGESYAVLGKPIFMDDLLKAKLGQCVLLEFVEKRASKKRKGATYNLITAKLGPMDPEFQPGAFALEEEPF